MAAAAAPVILGGLSLLQQREQARKQENLQRTAVDQNAQATEWQNKINDLQYPILQDQAALAKSYDPIKEGQDTVARATPLFEESLRKALNNLNASSEANMQPGISSEGQIRQANAVAGEGEAFKQFILEALMNPTAKKMQMTSAVLSPSAGNFTGGYFQSAGIASQLSQMFKPDYSGGLGMLNQALQSFMKPGGAGGRGDTTNQSMNQNYPISRRDGLINDPLLG